LANYLNLGIYWDDMEIKPNLSGLSEETKKKFRALADDEWRRQKIQANEAAMQPLLIRLDHIVRQLDLIVELLLERKN
jgi:hypothetical protein